MKINEPTTEIASAFTRWTRNRDVISGEDAVKARGDTYLPRHAGQTNAEYNRYLYQTPFFAGAGRTRDAMKGLITRKAGSLSYQSGLEALMETITPEGYPVSDLADACLDEMLTTGYFGLFVDVPPTSGPMSVKASETSNNRPFISIYAGENILEVTPGVVNNRQELVRIRLLENGGTRVREINLRAGLVEVTVHNQIDNNWFASEPFLPIKNGKPLTRIPFVLANYNRGHAPVSGPLDAIVWQNLHLYLAQADAKNSRYYSSAPILTIKGAAKSDITISPGKVLWFPDSTTDNPVDINFTEFSGAGQDSLESAVSTFKDEMAKLGSNLLASERNGTEAAETHAIRRSSENSILASLALTVSRRIEEALNIAADWAGSTEAVSFRLNTDFVPTPMLAADRSATLAEWQAAAISHRTYFDIMTEGEIMPSDFDAEEEIDRLANEAAAIDRPTAQTVTLTGKAPE